MVISTQPNQFADRKETKQRNKVLSGLQLDTRRPSFNGTLIHSLARTKEPIIGIVSLLSFLCLQHLCIANRRFMNEVWKTC